MYANLFFLRCFNSVFFSQKQVTTVLTEVVTFGKPGHILFQLSHITITFILLFHILHVEMSTFIIEGGVIKIRGRGQVVCIDEREEKDDT